MSDFANEPIAWRELNPQVLGIAMRSAPANALGPLVINGLNAAFDYADDHPNIKVMVIWSEVNGFFAAGADIKHMRTVDATEFAQYGAALREALWRLDSEERVSIAAIEGVALGGGLELALACTLRIGSHAARFGLPEVKLGLIPGAGGTQRLPRLVGRGHALDIMLTARQVGADEALRIGLIDRLVEPGSCLDTATELARSLCAMSMPALKAVMRSVVASESLPAREGHIFEGQQEQMLFETGEAQEGIAAFIERRPAKFV